jgi:hypothetical protein
LAGKTAREALDAFTGPMQRALTCVTYAQVYVRSAQPAELQALAVSEDPIALGTTGGPDTRLSLSVQQQYQIVRHDDPDRGPWKVATRGYMYELANANGQELLAYHWHPLGQSRWRGPHLHVSEGRMAGFHLPSGRVSLEELLRLLLAEVGVRPLRPDWQAVLDETEDAFRRYRTWA